jgi:hypothetical protein
MGDARDRRARDADAEGGVQPPGNPDPEAPLYSTVPLEDEDGNEYVVEQQAVGRQRVVGGGEFPDPDAPPQAPAPGSP